MENIINELSLNSQFNSSNEFIENSLPSFLEIFKVCNDFKFDLLKNYDFYNSKITKDLSLINLLTDKYISRTSDEIKRYKILIDKVTGEPYWETNSKIDPNSNYSISKIIVNNSGLSEAYERNCNLISFIPSDFEIDSIEVKKNEEIKSLNNFYNKKQLLDFLYQNETISFQEFCLKFYHKSKIDFSYSNIKESFDKLVTKTDENIFLSSFNMFAEMTWENIIAQGGKGVNKAGLAYSLYHNQSKFNQYNLVSKIYKFRANDKFRVFGYRDNDTFYVLEFDLTHKYSD